MHKYFTIYKPFQVLSQFSLVQNKLTLKDIFNVPPDVYPVGRLDYDSEGLLILTNDKKLTYSLLHPSREHEREYWVQVDGAVNTAALQKLSSGIPINIDGKIYHTKKCKAALFNEDPMVPLRNPPIRYRKNIPAPWIKMILTEGKNRQVRKMTAAAGFPTLRLIRYRIGQLTLTDMSAGDITEFSQANIQKLLFNK